MAALSQDAASLVLILAVVADAIVESKGGLPVVAYVKDEGEEVTMKDVIRQTDKENAEKLARIRAERQARQEAYEREQNARNAAREEGRTSGYQDRRYSSRRPYAKKVGEAKPAVEAKPVEVKSEGEK